jgi:hypothetical protein
MLDKASKKGAYEQIETSARLWNSCQGLIGVKDLLVQTRAFTEAVVQVTPP